MLRVFLELRLLRPKEMSQEVERSHSHKREEVPPDKVIRELPSERMVVWLMVQFSKT